jgi:predicted nucleotidyltransferase
MNALDILQGPRVEELCRRWNIVELAVFGSLLRDDFGPESDIDLLIDFSPEAHIGLFGLSRLQQELEDLLGRRVDVVTRSGIERSRNAIRRDAILSAARRV